MYSGKKLGDVDPNITTFPETVETQLMGVGRSHDTRWVEFQLYTKDWRR